MHPPPLDTPYVRNVQKSPGLAKASLTLGIIALLGGVILIVPTILAIVFGHVSLARIQREKLSRGHGIAIAGLVTGYASIISFFVLSFLAAMAIPAFQKVRENSLTKTMLNDARIIAGSAQQIMLADPSLSSVSFTVDPATGKVDGPISLYAPYISKGISVFDGNIEQESGTFSLQHRNVNNGEAVPFDIDGKPMMELSSPSKRTR